MLQISPSLHNRCTPHSMIDTIMQLNRLLLSSKYLCSSLYLYFKAASATEDNVEITWTKSLYIEEYIIHITLSVAVEGESPGNYPDVVFVHIAAVCQPTSLRACGYSLLWPPSAAGIAALDTCCGWRRQGGGTSLVVLVGDGRPRCGRLGGFSSSSSMTRTKCTPRILSSAYVNKCCAYVSRA